MSDGGIPSIDVKIITRPGLCIRCGGTVSQFCIDYGDDPTRGGIVKLRVKEANQRLVDICDGCVTDVDAKTLGFSSAAEMSGLHEKNAAKMRERIERSIGDGQDGQSTE